MKLTHKLGCTLVALSALCLAGAQPAQAVPMISFGGATNPALPTHADVSDYSNTGLDIGNDGFIFFNWNATTPNSGSGASIVAQNVNNELPSWLGVDFDPSSPTYSFGDDGGLETFAKGGESAWARLTTPEGFAGSGTGLSGALVDPAADNNSNNTIKGIEVGAGAPSSFWLHVVTDNTDLQHDPVSRLRIRGETPITGLDDDVKLQGLTFNGEPDVYSFLYENVAPGDVIKIQMNSGVFGEDPSIAGFMIDTVIPEPTSLVLFGLGLAGLGLGRRRS